MQSSWVEPETMTLAATRRLLRHCGIYSPPTQPRTMTIDLQQLAKRMADSNADTLAISQNGCIRVIHFWGQVTFSSPDALNEWIATGKLPCGSQSKFAKLVQQPRKI